MGLNAGMSSSMSAVRSSTQAFVWVRILPALTISAVAMALLVSLVVPGEYRVPVLLAPIAVMVSVLFLVRPEIVLILTIILTPVESSLSLNPYFPPGLSLLKVLGLLLLGVFVFNILLRRMRFRFMDDSHDLVTLLFSVAVLFSAITSAYPNAVANELDRIFRLVGLYFAVKNLVRSERTIKLIVVGLFLTILFASVHSILQYHLFAAPRANGFDDNPNNFALASVVAFSIGVYLLRSSRSLFLKVFYAAGLVALVIGIVLSASRGGMLSLGIVTALMVLRHPKRIQIGVAAILVLAAAFPLLPKDVSSRWFASGNGFQNSAEESATNSVARRSDYMALGMEIIAEHPVLGGGYRSFRQIYSNSDYAVLDNPLTELEISRVAHNVYLETVTGTGLFGLFAFVAMLLVAWRSFRAAGKMLAPRTIPWMAALGLEYALIGFAVSSVFISSEQQKYLWILMGMSSALHFYAKTHARPGAGSDQRVGVTSEVSPITA